MKRMYPLLNLIGYAAMVIVNILAERLPIGGKTTGEISAQYPVLVTPAGYAFAIWSLIYLLLLLFVFYGLTKKGRDSSSIAAIGPLFFLSCLSNITWILLWHYEQLTSSVFMMFALLISLIFIYSGTIRNELRNSVERWLVSLPFSIYLGWICVASIVNVAVALSANGWKGFGLSDTTWAVLMLCVAALLALVLGLRHRDVAIMLVFVWALVAIGVKQQAYPAVVWTAYACAGIVAIAVLGLLVRSVSAKFRGRQG
ncbi:tryptophan-rich sensory protein [Paenibacillus chungangensis]|uniref:Tryptophan-rich sensory protein n=1 Tax=Paenibacillus chungangensis TaxID=696535 RepID=A0ABW3HRK0_9BACL